MLGVIWLRGLVGRRTGRLVGQSIGVTLTVLLLASLGTFFASSRAVMTQQAVAAISVDWQVRVDPGADPARVLATVQAAPDVSTALEVGYADVSSFSSRVGGTVQTTGAGKVLGLPADHVTSFPGEIRYLVGGRSGVLLAQQTAANLGATVGSTVTIARPGQPKAVVKVDGIVDLPAADSLFQSIGLGPGAGPVAPPDNVMLLSRDAWQGLFAHAPPDTTTTQIHVGLDHALPADPGAAFVAVTGQAKHLEASLAGSGLVGDNLSVRLGAARSDALYAQLLFLFLGLPGVIIAGLLTAAIAASGRDRRRREQALLRVRGASPRQTMQLASYEALLTGTVGTALGLAGASIAGWLAFGTARFGATGGQTAAWALFAALVGFGLSFVTIVVTAWRDSRSLTVRASQVTIGSPHPPIWEWLYLDIVCLVTGGLIYWQAVRGGYQVVLAPEGVPTISVNYFTLMAPLLFWVGAGLLTWRVGRWLLEHGRGPIAALSRPFAHGLSGVVAASMSRQRQALARGLVLMALTASFALSVGIFNTTYANQSRVDAQLTNGADVAVATTASAGLPPGLTEAVRQIPGVTAAQPMLHRFAYVGNDLQDLYGIDPAAIGQATTMSNAFFTGGSAQQVLRVLASTPNGVLVSQETVHDFQLHEGDTVRLRLQFAGDHAYHLVPFVYVGVAREFPTAPHDSFLVTNARYVGQQTGSTAAQTLLVRTDASPPVVADRVRNLLGPASGATVQDIVSQERITLSGLTAIDLAGLTRLELAFAIVLAAGASGLFLGLSLVERRRTFAIASALGAKRQQLGAFVWSEAAFVTICGAALGAIAGWGIAQTIVKILTGVFDPPPEHLSIPSAYLGVFAALTAAAVVIAGSGILRATRRDGATIIRDL